MNAVTTTPSITPSIGFERLAYTRKLVVRLEQRSWKDVLKMDREQMKK